MSIQNINYTNDIIHLNYLSMAIGMIVNRKMIHHLWSFVINDKKNTLECLIHFFIVIENNYQLVNTIQNIHNFNNSYLNEFILMYKDALVEIICFHINMKRINVCIRLIELIQYHGDMTICENILNKVYIYARDNFAFEICRVICDADSVVVARSI
jgi:hypothetical protein